MPILLIKVKKCDILIMSHELNNFIMTKSRNSLYSLLPYSYSIDLYKTQILTIGELSLYLCSCDNDRVCVLVR